MSNKLKNEECNYCKSQLEIDQSLHTKYINCANCNAKHYFRWGTQISFVIVKKIDDARYELYVNYSQNYTEITRLDKFFRTVKIKNALQINRNNNIEDKIKTILSLQ